MKIVLLITLVSTANWDILFPYLVSSCQGLLIFNNLAVNLQLNQACSCNKINKCRRWKICSGINKTDTGSRQLHTKGNDTGAREGVVNLVLIIIKNNSTNILWCECQRGETEQS